MKEIDQTKRQVTRREFLGTTAAAAALSLVPFHFSCSAPNRSIFGGVQIGTITYSFRGLSGLEETLQACIDSGVGSIELMGNGVETYLGAPEQIRVPRRFTPPPGGFGAAPGGAPPGGMPQGFPGMGQQEELSEEELAELEQRAAEAREALLAWRETEGEPERYKEIRKLFNDAGIDIHIYKWTAGNSEEELDYSFKVAKALGAMGITTEGPRQPNDEAAYSQVQAMGAAAENNGMYVILHNHDQYRGMTIEDIEGILDLSPAVRLNFDCGHYFGFGNDATGQVDPVQFIEHFASMDRITSIHLKDKTSLENENESNTNKVWGQGETPLSEILLLVQNKYPKIYCDIELEYPIPEDSDSVAEVAKCVEFCRNILAPE